MRKGALVEDLQPCVLVRVGDGGVKWAPCTIGYFDRNQPAHWSHSRRSLKSVTLISMARTKNPKVEIKREKTSLGWAYVIYIDGHDMGAGLTRASAEDGAKRMLAIYEKQKQRGLWPD